MFMIYFLHAFCSNDCNINQCFMLRIFFFPMQFFLSQALAAADKFT